MKKLLIIASLFFASLTSYAEQINVVTLPAATVCTNLYDGGTKLTEIVFDPTASSAIATNLSFKLFDAAKIMPYIGGAGAGVNITNGIVYTNAGYVTYTYGISNMNWLAAGSAPVLGLNSNRSPEGVTMTITNSSVLSNTLVTVSNWNAGALVVCPIRASGSVPSNATYTLSFPNGLYFARGITLSNAAGGGATIGGYTITLTHTPFK